MSSLTLSEAYDDIMMMFKEGWGTTGFKAFYEDVEDERKPNDEPYVKAEVNFGDSRQNGFGGGHDGSEKLFMRYGDFRCKIHTLAGNGLSESLVLAKVVLDSFEGKHSPGGVWFRSTNTEDIGRNGTFRIFEVAVFFTFDERK